MCDSIPTVAVVGGGWYGSHIALALHKRGFTVTLFESQDSLFQGASGKNQFRLHAGFHYPRSFTTRSQIGNGLKEFIDRLPQFARRLDKCIYAISNTNSLVDFGTFKSIFSAEGTPYYIIHPEVYGISNVEGALHSPDEGVFYVDTPRNFYEVSHYW